MRLIDADALIAQMEADAEQMEEPIAAMFAYAAISDIKHAPTIEPERKTGKWIEEQRGIKVTLYKCSECGRTVMDDTGYDVAKDYPFCHCGAEMNGSE